MRFKYFNLGKIYCRYRTIMKFWQSRYNPQLKISQQDLLDISNEITGTYVPHDTHHKPELVLIPVDPVNLYAYWNLKENKTDNEINHIDKQLALRIYSIPQLSEQHRNIQFSFDININDFQNQQKVHLPIAATAYSAVIGEINTDNSFTTLACANVIQVPRENPVNEISQNNSENTVKIDNILESNVVTHHAPRETPEAENNLNNCENTLKTDHALTKKIVPEASTQDTQPAAFILKNFNAYGYDLKIHVNKPGSEYKNIFSKQDINALLNTKESNTIEKNTSGKGRLL